MNLFWLDTDPVLAAQAHQDIHVGKMLLEAVQLLCTAFPQPATFWLSWYRPVWQFAAAGLVIVALAAALGFGARTVETMAIDTWDSRSVAR